MSAHRGHYTGGPANRFLPIAHSRLRRPARGELWPPQGWTNDGLALHMARFRAAKALLVALADPRAAERLEEADTRAAEARQLGADAAQKLRDAHEAVMALTNITSADTRELDMRERGEAS